jgi:3-methyladenine DNA glycosylase AlkD
VSVFVPVNATPFCCGVASAKTKSSSAAGETTTLSSLPVALIVPSVTSTSAVAARDWIIGRVAATPAVKSVAGPAPKAFGVSVGDIRGLGKTLKDRQDLAEPLWATGWYEARMLVAFVADPAAVTPAQMDRQAKAFDNWAICDTLCFHLYDKTPHAWTKIDKWSGQKPEFVKRAGFALLASVAVHDKKAPDAPFIKSFKLIERESTDERNFVKKAVNWALRGIGARNPALFDAAHEVAERLAASTDSTARWNGRDALRQFAGAASQKRLAAQKKKAKSK